MLNKILIIIAAIVIVLALAFFAMLIKKAYDSHKNVPTVGVQANGMLLPCPDKPNCVSSDSNSNDQQHYIQGFPASKWLALQDYLKQQSNVAIITNTPNYIYVTYTTSIMRFVDDVEFHLRPTGIAVRSASREGYSDLEANRKRIEAIRELMRAY